MNIEKYLLLSDPNNREFLTVCKSISRRNFTNDDFECFAYIEKIGLRK